MADLGTSRRTPQELILTMMPGSSCTSKCPPISTIYRNSVPGPENSRFFGVSQPWRRTWRTSAAYSPTWNSPASVMPPVRSRNQPPHRPTLGSSHPITRFLRPQAPFRFTPRLLISRGACVLWNCCHSHSGSSCSSQAASPCRRFRLLRRLALRYRPRTCEPRSASRSI